MTETLNQELPLAPACTARDRHVRTAASRLRQLADWLDAHEIYDDELTCAWADGWGESHIQVGIEAEILKGRSLSFCPRGHAKFELDGTTVVTLLPQAT